jgi:hypothetical protein
MRYIILSDTVWFKLVEEVNDYIKKGYVPTGGLAVRSGGAVLDSIYFQAMIDEKREPI